MANPEPARSPFAVGFVSTLAALAVYALARCLILARGVLLLFLTAAVLAVGLDLAAQGLQRRGCPRRTAVGVVLLGLVLSVAATAAVLAPVVVSQISHLVSQLPGLLGRARGNNVGVLGSLDRRFHFVDALGRAEPNLTRLVTLSSVLGVIRTALAALVGALTVLALTVYLVIEMPAVKAALYRMYPRTRRARASILTDEILRRTGGFILGNLLTSGVVLRRGLGGYMRL